MKGSERFKDFFDLVTEEWNGFANSDGFFYLERGREEEEPEYLQNDLITYSSDFKKAKVFYSYEDANGVMDNMKYDNNVFVSRMEKTKSDVENDIKKIEMMND